MDEPSSVAETRKCTEDTSVGTKESCDDGTNDEKNEINTSKKQKQSFSFKEKFEILNELETKSEGSVLDEFNISSRTLRKCKRKRKEIVQMCKKENHQNLKRNREPKNRDVDDALYIWFLKERARGMAVSGQFLQRKALEINEKLNGNKKFNASEGWLEKWKAGKGIQSLRISDEKLCIDNKADDVFKIKIVANIIKDEPFTAEEVIDENVQNSDKKYERATNMDELSRVERKRQCSNDMLVGSRESCDDGSNDEKNDMNKKQKQSFSFKEKSDILSRLETESEESVLNEFKLSGRTLRRWKIRRKEIIQMCATGNLQDLKKNRPPKNKDVNDALYIWFLQERARGMPVSGPFLQKKALELNEELSGNKEFKASEGWLEKWKARRGIRLLRITDEKLSADSEAGNKFDRKSLANIIKDEPLTTEEIIDENVQGETYEMVEPARVVRERIYAKDTLAGRKECCDNGRNDERSNMNKKRKQSFTFKEKLEILNRLETESEDSVLNELNLSGRTLRRWKTRRKEIIQMCTEENLQDLKKNRPPKNKDVNDALYRWFVQESARGTFVSGALLQKKALELNEELSGNKEFKASEGWLEKWKSRRGIRLLKITDEKLSADSEVRNELKIETLAIIIKDEPFATEKIIDENVQSIDKELEKERNVIDESSRVARTKKYTQDTSVRRKESCDDGSNVEKNNANKCKKRKQSFSFKEKLEILNKLETESEDSVRNKLNLNSGTLRKWKIRKREIVQMCKKENLQDLKKNRPPKNKDVNDALYIWFLQERARGMPVSGPFLQKKALELNEELNGNKEFKASEGWLEKWKARRGIRLLKITGKKLSTNSNAENEFKINTPMVIIKDEPLTRE